METFLNSSKPLLRTFVKGQNYGPKKAVLNIVFNIACYLKLCNAITITIFCISHFFFQQRWNWLFGHYRTLSCLLGKKLH